MVLWPPGKLYTLFIAILHDLHDVYRGLHRFYTMCDICPAGAISIDTADQICKLASLSD